VGGRFVTARQFFDRRARGKVELWPYYLLTINWADSGPGFSWPVAYNAIYVPGFDRTVVTASGDCTSGQSSLPPPASVRAAAAAPSDQAPASSMVGDQRRETNPATNQLASLSSTTTVRVVF